ncbi:hypothetical protein HDV04_005501 [Boothiomyces sp. JEL0838]|nr:hypothetical protein HDV04_005501 [Boothiomyces sp. JEL0838]
MLAYLIGFAIVWFPTSINRIVQIALGSPVFAIGVIHASLTPTRGLINFCAYFYAWWYSPANVRDRSGAKSSDTASGKKDKHADSQKLAQAIRTSPSIDTNDSGLRNDTSNMSEKTRKFSDLPTSNSRKFSMDNSLKN